MRTHPYVSWVPDVLEPLAASPSATHEFRTYLASPGLRTAQDLAWSLSGLTWSHAREAKGTRNLALIQSAVALLRHEVDACVSASADRVQATKDLIYLLINFAHIRLDRGTPESTLRAADEALARLSVMLHAEPTPRPEDLELIGDILQLRAQARQTIVVARPLEERELDCEGAAFSTT